MLEGGEERFGGTGMTTGQGRASTRAKRATKDEAAPYVPADVRLGATPPVCKICEAVIEAHDWRVVGPDGAPVCHAWCDAAAARGE